MSFGIKKDDMARKRYIAAKLRQVDVLVSQGGRTWWMRSARLAFKINQVKRLKDLELEISRQADPY
jgi:hypothetical protein